MLALMGRTPALAASAKLEIKNRREKQ